MEACICKPLRAVRIFYNDATTLPVEPVMGHSLRELAKLKIPLVGSVRLQKKGPSVELGATHSQRLVLVPARPKHDHDAC